MQSFKKYFPSIKSSGEITLFWSIMHGFIRAHKSLLDIGIKLPINLNPALFQVTVTAIQPPFTLNFGKTSPVT